MSTFLRSEEEDPGDPAVPGRGIWSKCRRKGGGESVFRHLLFFRRTKKVLTKRPGSSIIFESLRGTNAMKRKVACRKQGFFVEYVRTGRICRSRIGRLGNWRRSTPGICGGSSAFADTALLPGKARPLVSLGPDCRFYGRGNAVFHWERIKHADGCTRYRMMRKEHH